jgi:hypothetical protein
VLVDDPPYFNLIYMSKYFQILIYFISQDM